MALPPLPTVGPAAIAFSPHKTRLLVAAAVFVLVPVLASLRRGEGMRGAARQPLNSVASMIMLASLGAHSGPSRLVAGVLGVGIGGLAGGAYAWGWWRGRAPIPVAGYATLLVLSAVSAWEARFER